MKPLTFLRFLYYNKCVYDKNNDEDSRIIWKITASRKWWKTGMSKNYLKITSELQMPKIYLNE